MPPGITDKDYVISQYDGEIAYMDSCIQNIIQVLISNNILDPYFEWPMDTREFEAYIKKKYGSIAAAQAVTIHCEHSTKNITVSADSLTVSNGVSSGDYNAIDTYTWEERINDNRRFIKLVDRQYLPQIEMEMKNMFFNKGEWSRVIRNA